MARVEISCTVLQVLMACTRTFPLPEVPVVGGTAEQRAQVAAELVDFDEQIGTERLFLSEVRFEPLDFEGLIHLTSRRIALDDNLDGGRLDHVLRHELCHALDYSEDLAQIDQDFFDELGEAVAGAEDSRIDEVSLDARSLRSEALATYCGVGALAAFATAESCAEEAPQIAEIAVWLTEFVWSASRYDTLLDWAPAVHSSWFAAHDLRTYDIEADGTLQPPNGLAISGSIGEASSTAWDDGITDFSAVVDIDSGAVLSVALEDIEDEKDMWWDLGDPPGGIECNYGGRPRGWLDGPAAAWCTVEFVGLGRSDARLLVMSDSDLEWRATTNGCALPGYELFVARGAVWTAWIEDATVKWSEVR